VLIDQDLRIAFAGGGFGDNWDSSEDGDKAEQADRTGPQPLAAPWPKVTTDYHGALVRLATLRAAKTQHLLFGYVELFPRDIAVPEAFNAGEKPWAVPDFGGDSTLGVSALPMSVADALAWYEKAAMGQVTIPLSNPVALNAPGLGAEPALGGFCIGETVPFAARWRDGPRIHRLAPMDDPPEAVTHLGSSLAARAWLADNAGFDPFDFEEWLGSLSLFAPDPHHTGGCGQRARLRVKRDLKRLGPHTLALEVSAFPRILRAAYAHQPKGLSSGPSRFSSSSGEFRVLYAAPDFAAAFTEAIARDRFVDRQRRYTVRVRLPSSRCHALNAHVQHQG
jgi:hypothetical protein